MKNPTTKIASLFGLYIVLHFVAACMRNGNCDCPNPQFPFFDYQALTVEANDPISTGYLILTVQPDSIDYVVEATQQPDFEWFPTAMACSCVDDGYEGDKYAIADFDVFADQDFNDTLRVGTPLNAIFFTANSDVVSSLDSPFVKPTLFGRTDRELRLFLHEKPENMDQPYRFTIRLIKANGDTLSVQTNTIRFQ